MLIYPQIRRGFIDGFYRNKMPPDYAKWDRPRQVIYEQMRLAGVMARVNRIDWSWPPDVLLPAEIADADYRGLLDAD